MQLGGELQSAVGTEAELGLDTRVAAPALRRDPRSTGVAELLADDQLGATRRAPHGIGVCRPTRQVNAARLGATEAVLDIVSTYTPREQRGQNVAARLTRAALDYAAAEGLCVVPTCSYTRVGKPGSSLLEQDETRVGGLAMQQASDARLLPEEVQVRDPAWDQHDVEGGFAHHLKRDAEVTALRVPRLGLHEAWLAPRASADVNG